MRVLIGDDQPQVRSTLQILLKQEPGVRVVSEASEIKGLLAQVQAIHPDLVLRDWDYPVCLRSARCLFYGWPAPTYW